MIARLSLAGLIAVLVWTAPPSLSQADDVSDAVKTLQDANLSTEDDALVEFFRSRTLAPDQRESLSRTVSQLGHDSFDVREAASAELVRAGAIAIPLLKIALREGDVETIFRAEQCLEKIRVQVEPNRVLAAATLLADRMPPGTVEVLFAYLINLPEDDGALERLTEILEAISEREESARQLLLPQLQNDRAAARRFAGRILAHTAPESRSEVSKLLQDPDHSVRYTVAEALVRAGERDAVPALISLIGEGPKEFAYLSEDLLCRLLEDTDPPATLGVAGPDDRERARSAWDAWWQERSAGVDLSVLNTTPPYRGLTIIVEVDNNTGFNNSSGRIWECGPDGQQRWEITNVGGPVDVQVLPGGRLLIAEYYARRITERDRHGEIIWDSGPLSGNPVGAERLPNGNTLIAVMNEVFELTPERQRVGAYPAVSGTVFDVTRGKDGHTFVLSSGQLTDISPDGKTVGTIKVDATSGWGGIEFLPDGHFLVSQYTSGNKVVEIDETGKERWSVDVATPTRAQRLRNGHTLVAGGNNYTVVEFDRDGTKVWETATKGRPFSVLRY